MVDVVEHQGRGLGVLPQPGDQSRQRDGNGARWGHREPGGEVLGVTRGVAERVREVTEEHERVVVVAGEPQPGDRPAALRGVLPEQRRLAVPGGRMDEEHGAVDPGGQPLEQARARDRLGRPQVGLQAAAEWWADEGPAGHAPILVGFTPSR